ncbi:sodium-dependent phosphate transport protein 2B-like [Eucyclogobius newberryi]|uniref:sodium-dependent phosphate transport protein 2B-like n=1 Tax=Eucyclogobius newberryi TaxID=166745 RepID=UPI003B5B282E
MGILLWYPFPIQRVPIRLARGLGNMTAEYRWFAAFYLIIFFLVMPISIFGLSLAGRQVLVGVGIPLMVIVLFAIIVNMMQKKCPRFLPTVLHTWDFLPKPLRSLAIWDHVVTVSLGFCGNRCCCCCKCCSCCNKEKDEKVAKGSVKSLQMYANPAMTKDEDVVNSTYL